MSYRLLENAARLRFVQCLVVYFLMLFLVSCGPKLESDHDTSKSVTDSNPVTRGTDSHTEDSSTDSAFGDSTIFDSEDSSSGAIFGDTTGSDAQDSSTGTTSEDTTSSDTESLDSGTDTESEIEQDSTVTDPPATETFVSTWQTNEPGVSGENEILLPLVSTGTYNFRVDWGDGTSDIIRSWDDPAKLHTYSAEGTYEVRITGTFENWQFPPENLSNESLLGDLSLRVQEAGSRFDPSIGWIDYPRTITENFPIVSDAAKITDISQWGKLVIGNTQFQFFGCSNMSISASDTPDLSKTTSLKGAFVFGANLSHEKTRMQDWDTSTITDMSWMFAYAYTFNEFIVYWNTTNVTDMNHMFANAYLSLDGVGFNQHLGFWDTSSVTDMSYMFDGIYYFNGDLTGWDTSNVTKMASMFRHESTFERYLGIWDTSKVTDMTDVFDSLTPMRVVVADNSGNIDDAPPPEAEPFITVWDLEKKGVNMRNQIELPLVSNGHYNFEVDWGDGTGDIIRNWNDPAKLHTYKEIDIYEVKITGEISGWQFPPERYEDEYLLENSKLTVRRYSNNATEYFGIIGPSNVAESAYISDASMIIAVHQWGPLKLGNTRFQFYGCVNLTEDALDEPNLSETTSLRGALMFVYSHRSDSTVNSLGRWDTSTIGDMSWTFAYNPFLQLDVSSWDTSNVTTMKGMFSHSSDAIDVSHYFWEEWEYILDVNHGFNGDLSQWDTSRVTDMSYMFDHAGMFNQNIGNWDTANVLNMSHMFDFAIQFNQNIGNWDTSNVNDMSYMFRNAVLFNQNLNNWNTSTAVNMKAMLLMTDEYYNYAYPDWSGTYAHASHFDQNLVGFDISSVANMAEMFGTPENGFALSTDNYDATLNSWATQPVQTGVIFDAGNSTYSAAAVSSRQKLVEEFGWIISDGGLVE